MRKILALLIIAAFIMLIPARARALGVERFDLDLGYSKDSLDNRNFFIQFDLALEEPDKMGFLLGYEMFRNQTPTDLNLLFDTDVQVNCYLVDPAYLFVNSGYLRDTARGAEQVDVGAGLGIRFLYGALQTGVFGRSTMTTDEVFSISSADVAVPLGRVVRLVEEVEYEVNVDDRDDALFTADTSLVIALSDNIGLRTGLKYIYDNQPLPGYDDNFRWWYGGVSISF